MNNILSGTETVNVNESLDHSILRPPSRLPSRASLQRLQEAASNEDIKPMDLISNERARNAIHTCKQDMRQYSNLHKTQPDESDDATPAKTIEVSVSNI